MKTYKGRFKPNNPKKYIGDANNIIYRSSYELKFMRFLDNHKDVLKWASEELAIPYVSPVDRKVHRYFPDFIVERINKKGKKEILMVEIKPYFQTIEPKRGSKSERTFLSEVRTWGINQAKWNAATEYCLDRGWKFMLMTEKELYGKK